VSALERNNVTVHGRPDGRPMMFAHGFGCDQSMWRFVWPAFGDEYRIVLSRLVLLAASGHCPNLSAPEETVTAIKQFLAE
jgi:pimeloyl-ACP methyl ester carboxylesterase